MSADLNNVTEEIIHNLSRLFLGHLPKRPNLAGRGIVIGVIGTGLLTNAWICIGMLKRCGCKLPIQIWYWNEGDFDSSLSDLFASVGVQFKMVSAENRYFLDKHPDGHELGIVAALESPYKEVLVLDADNMPVTNPELLFNSLEFLRAGAVLWPAERNIEGVDLGKFSLKRRLIHEKMVLDLGQMLLNKEAMWDVLNLALWYGKYSDFFYPALGGLQAVLQLAFLNTQRQFAIPAKAAVKLSSALCHHDFSGNRLFQHRNGAKWELYKENAKIEGFLREQECFDLLSELKAKSAEKYRLKPFNLKGKSSQVQRMAAIVTSGLFEYRRIGYGDRNMTFLANGIIGVGSAGCELFWDIYEENNEICLEIAAAEEKTCVFRRSLDGIWRGRWLHHEKMAVELAPIKTSIPKTNFQRIVFSAPINSYTGYGLHACAIIRGLEACGYDVAVKATVLEQTLSVIPDDISEKLVAGTQNEEWEMALQVPDNFYPVAGKRNVLFTMWESTRLAPHVVSRLNQAKCIIVPSAWNKNCFQESGISIPIYIVPLGIHEDIFHYAPMDMVGPCIFGVAGRTADGGARKGINELILAFGKAFPTETDVRLFVKIFPDCDVPKSSDPRIKFTRAFLPERELGQWFRSLTCFVSGAKGEGWGLMQHQAIACGRPLISVAYGAVTEFFDDQVGYPVKYKLKPAGGRYQNCGDWAEPDEKHLIKRMHEVYKDRGNARKMGKLGSQRISTLTWENSVRKLIAVLQRVGVLEKTGKTAKN